MAVKRILKLSLLLLSIQFAYGDWLKHYNKHRNTAKLMEATNEPLNNANASPYEQVHYSTANLSSDYKSSMKFQPRGMAHLYTLTDKFINFISKDEAFPKDFFEVTDENTIQVADIGKEWPSLLSHYGAVLIVILSAILFATVMPIVGLTFCCCRCAGRCGARSQPFDKRYDPCRRYFYGAILVIITVLISYGVICAFTTNEVLEEGVTDLPKHVRTALTDTELYINNTKKEVQTLLITNFNELEKSLSNILRASGKIILDKLAQDTKASVLSNLTSVVDGLSLIKNDLNLINAYTVELRKKSAALDHGLRNIAKLIMKDIQECRDESACKQFYRRFNKVDQLSLETNFSQLPNVTITLKNLSDLSAAGIEREVTKGKKEFEKIQNLIQNSVESNIPSILKDISKTGKAIEEGAHRVIEILDNMKAITSKEVNRPIDDGEQLISDFSPYRYYLCLGVSFALLLILVCLSLGLLCGCFGSRPNSGYQEDCCNKGTGSRYLMIAVWLMFLTSGFLMAVALVYFVAGVSTEKLMCQSLENPNNSRTFTLLEKLVNPNRFYKSAKSDDAYGQIDLREMISLCHRNLSLYEVLQLRKEIDLTQVRNYLQSYGIHERIDQLVGNIKLDDDIDIITPEAYNLLEELANSNLNNIDFPAYSNVVGSKLTSIDLLQLAAALNETAAKLPPEDSDISYSLHNSALYLHMHHEAQVADILLYAKNLESTAAQLQEHLKFNHTSLEQAVKHLVEEVRVAQQNLKKSGRSIVTKLAKNFGTEFVNHVQDYLNRVSDRMKYDIGRCWPISQAYNATVIAGCNRILSPFNGFWFSVGAVVLLFLPTIIICVILANLYQKSDRYPGPLVEAEYLYDVYGSDRDNVPLANIHDKKKKKSNRRTADESSANMHHGSGSSYHGAANNVDRARTRSVAPSLGSPAMLASSAPLTAAAPTISPQVVNENRFEDVSTKQKWEYPVNASNFQSASVAHSNEYERPPPYYYPGPTPQGAISD